MKGYTVVLSPDPEVGGYTAVCPAMPGAVAEGDTREQTLGAMAHVMVAWLELAAEDGRGPLDETPELIAAVIAEVLEDRDAEGWDRTIETAVLQPAVAAAA